MVERLSNVIAETLGQSEEGRAALIDLVKRFPARFAGKCPDSTSTPEKGDFATDVLHVLSTS